MNLFAFQMLPYLFVFTECECSCKDTMFLAIIGLLGLIIILLIIIIIWKHKKGKLYSEIFFTQLILRLPY